MDKILFRGDVSVRALERIGVGIKVGEDVKRRAGVREEEDWVSDHYGVMGDFDFDNGWSFRAMDEEGMVRPKLS